LTDTKTEKIAQSSTHAPSRRMAREIALKVAYAHEMRNCEQEEVLRDQMITGGVLPPAYTVRLLAHVEQYREQLDDIIRLKVEKWEFSRIAVLDRIVLRLAAAELHYFPDVPPKVSINEAIEIAKKFSTEKSGKFINGILDAMYSDIVRGSSANNNGGKNP